MDPDFLSDILKMNEMAVTAARIAILQILFRECRAFVELNQLLKMSPATSRTTLYRTLIAFCDADLLYKIVDAKNRIFYGMGDKLKAYLGITELTNKNNYHFQCSSCGKIFCLREKMHAIELPEGFTKTGSNLLLSGECNICIPKKKSIRKFL